MSEILRFAQDDEDILSGFTMRVPYRQYFVALLSIVLWAGCGLSPDRKRINPPQAEDATAESKGDELGSTTGDPTSPTTETPSVPLVINYQEHVAPILTSSCLGAGCHTPPNAAGSIALDTYDNAKLYMTSSITSINAKRMPKPDKTISAADIQTLQKWVDGQMPETATSAPPAEAAPAGTPPAP
ncbi:MAG: hypothetical protein AB7T49_07850 [Oligoflexales bacterium]